MEPRTEIFLTLSDLRSRRDNILKLAEKHGAFNVRVFGSIARGEATPDNDIDFLVDFRRRSDMECDCALALSKVLLGREVNVVAEELPQPASCVQSSRMRFPCDLMGEHSDHRSESLQPKPPLINSCRRTDKCSWITKQIYRRDCAASCMASNARKGYLSINVPASVKTELST